MFLAMQSGELDGQVIGMGSARGAQPALWNGGQLRPLLQFGRLTRVKEFPDVPTGRELLKDPSDLKLLDQQKLDSVAAVHTDGFVSAFYVPGQLLVVRGKFASPERANILIERKMYRDVYTDLNAAAEPATKLFVSDLGANGLKFRRDNGLSYRPEQVTVVNGSVAECGAQGQVIEVEFIGHSCILTVDVALDSRVQVRSPVGSAPKVGATVSLSVTGPTHVLR